MKCLAYTKQHVMKLPMASWLPLGAVPVSAATNASIGGEVERIVVNTPTDTWSGGIMVVSGRNSIIPRNMQDDDKSTRCC